MINQSVLLGLIKTNQSDGSKSGKFKVQSIKVTMRSLEVTHHNCTGQSPIVAYGNEIVACDNEKLTYDNDRLTYGNEILTCGNQIVALDNPKAA